MALVLAGGRLAAFAPAELAPVAAEQPCRGELTLVAVGRAVRRGLGERRDEERVDRTPGLAHEAGLAVVLAGDLGDPGRAAVEHVRRAHADADVATDAPLAADELDHDASTAGALTGATGSTVVQTSSSPPVSSRCCRPGSSSGRSRRLCIPRVSGRAAAAAYIQRAWATIAAASRVRTASLPSPATPVRPADHRSSSRARESASASARRK